MRSRDLKKERSFYPSKIQKMIHKVVNSPKELNTSTCVSPWIAPTEEDYEAADDASVTSSMGAYDTVNGFFAGHTFSSNPLDFKFHKNHNSRARTNTDNYGLKHNRDSGGFQNEKKFFKDTLLDAKRLSDSQLGALNAEIFTILNEKNVLSEDILLIRKHLDSETRLILKELALIIEKFLELSFHELLIPASFQSIMEELYENQSKISERKNGALGWFGLQTSMAIFGLHDLIERFQSGNANLFIGSNDVEPKYKSSLDAFGINLEGLEKSLPDRLLFRPSLGQLSISNNIKQNDWTYNEFIEVAEEGKLLNVVILFLKSGEVSFISPSVTSVFGNIN